MQRQLRILLFSTTETLYEQIKMICAEVVGYDCQVTWVVSLEDGSALLAQESYQMVFLAENCGLDFLADPLLKAHPLPVIFLLESGNHELGIEALKQGACLYCLLAAFSAITLPQIIANTLNLQQIRQAQRQTQDLLQAVIQDQTELIARSSADGVITFANEAFCRYFEVNLEDILGKVFISPVHPDDLEEFQASLKQLTYDNPVQTHENRVVVKGKIRWSHWTNRAIFDAHKQPIAYQTVGRDTTEEKHIQEQLAHQAFLLNNIQDAIVVSDLKYIVQFWGKGAERLYGWKAEEIIGKRVPDVLHTQFIEGQTREQLTERLLKHGQWRGEARQQHKDGTWRWIFSLVSTYKDEDGQPIGAIAVNTDITDRKHAQELVAQQAHLLNSIRDGVFSADMNFRLESWNHGAEVLYGWSEAEAKGQFMSELLQTEFSRGITRNDMLNALWQGGQWTGQTRQRRKDGTRIWTQLSLSLRYNSLHQPIGIIGISTDLTAQKLAEQQEHELEAERERARLLHRFLGNLTHDLITPLTTLKTGLYLASKAKEEEKRQHHLQRMEYQVSKLEQLLQKMFTLQELDSPQLQLALKSQSLNSCVTTILTEYNNYPHQVNLNLRDELPHVRFDFHQLKTAIRELLLNAFAYTPPTGTISIRSYPQKPYVILEIKDNGAGISPQDLPYIFDRFYRADQARNTNTGGAGLGLALAKLIIEHHNGRIEVESTLGAGSCFSIYLPI